MPNSLREEEGRDYFDGKGMSHVPQPKKGRDRPRKTSAQPAGSAPCAAPRCQRHAKSCAARSGRGSRGASQRAAARPRAGRPPGCAATRSPLSRRRT
eukprot:3872173-Prymnesium_polylepis.1